MAFIDRRTGIVVGKVNPYQSVQAANWKGLQELKLIAARRVRAMTEPQKMHTALTGALASRFRQFTLAQRDKWTQWAEKNSDAAHLIEQEMEVGRHFMTTRRKARHKIDAQSAYIMCNLAAFYAGLPFSDEPPDLFPDNVSAPTELKLNYILDEKYPDGAIEVKFTDPHDVKTFPDRINKARLYLCFMGGDLRIGPQLAGNIELPLKSPIIVEQMRGAGVLLGKSVRFKELGTGSLYAVLDTVGQYSGRAALPSKYGGPQMIRINIDPEGMEKSNKKIAKVLGKFPAPKKLG